MTRRKAIIRGQRAATLAPPDPAGSNRYPFPMTVEIRCLADLLSQVADVRVDGPGLHFVRHAANLGENALARNDGRPVADQQPDSSNSFFASRTSAPWRKTRTVFSSISSSRRRNRRLVGGDRSAPGSPRRARQLAHAERLGEVVVGAELEAGDAVALPARGEHQDRDVGVARSRRNSRQMVNPSRSGKIEIEDQEIEVAVLDASRPSCPFAKCGRDNPPAAG